MGKKISAGVSNVSLRCPKGWVGVSNIAQKIKKGWIGDANGKAQPFFSSGVDAGEVVFTASKTWTVPEGVKTIDIFCVGGGGGAGGGYFDMVGATTSASSNYYYGGGSGSGYTATALGIDVTPGETLTVTVGAGGTSGQYRTRYTYNGTVQDDSASTGGYATKGLDGGTSEVYRGTTQLITASGGVGAAANTSSTYTAGARGGSGGGTGGKLYRYENYNNGSVTYSLYEPTAGGIDGGNGVKTINVTSTSGSSTSNGSAGTGQGKTTRYFGESNGTLYATGGGKGTSTVANSGNGAGVYYANVTGGMSVNESSSGVVIIRWPEQED